MSFDMPDFTPPHTVGDSTADTVVAMRWFIFFKLKILTWEIKLAVTRVET